jgi:hypothetical protein
MTAPRPILANRFYLLSRRCTQGEFLLRPDDLTNQTFLYCLAVAAQRFDIGVVSVVTMSNHYHAVVYDPVGVLPRFLEHVHALSARALNRRRGRRENFWSAEQPNINYLVEMDDVVDKTVYALANPVASNLVDRALNWPGVSSMAWLDGRTIQVKRPKVFFAKSGAMPESVALKLIVPPGFEGGQVEWSELIRARVAERERACAAAREVKGTRVLGRKAVLAASPSERAKSLDRSELKPFVAAKRESVRIQALAALKEFRSLYRRARRAFRDGVRNTRFPAGTFALVHWCGVLAAPR